MKSPENPAVSSTAQIPLVFTAKNYRNLSSWHWNPGLFGLAWGWDLSLPRYLSWFFSTIRECGTVPSAATTASPCLSTSVGDSTPPVSLDEYGFFKSLAIGLHAARFSNDSGCYFFWDLAILSMIVSGGEACLPIPLSWLEVPKNFFIDHGWGVKHVTGTTVFFIEILRVINFGLQLTLGPASLSLQLQL